MVGVFKERNTFQVIILVIMAAVAKLVYLLNPPIQAYLPLRGVLSGWLSTWYTTASPFLLAFLAFVVNIGSAFYANAVLSDQRMFAKNKYAYSHGNGDAIFIFPDSKYVVYRRFTYTVAYMVIY